MELKRALYNNVVTSIICNNLKVVAVAARDLMHAQSFAAKHGIPRAYGSYEELAKDSEIGE